MFTKKKDLDAYVQELFRKAKSEKERNAKCLTIARQYLQLKEWAACRRYVGAYIQDHPGSAPALRLQAECEENLGNQEQALNSFRSSLTCDGSQKDVVFKVCELLCSVESDTDTYQYWADRGESIDASHPAVFKLKEHILTKAAAHASGVGVPIELETLIMAEQKARPHDPSPNMRLLRLYADKNQFSKAYALAVQIEGENSFRNDISWYQAVVQTIEDCQNKIDCDWDFHSFKLLALERLAFLSIDKEIGANQLVKKTCAQKTALNDVIEIVFKLDQALFASLKVPQPNSASRRTVANYLHRHVTAQFTFYLVCILLKKAKKDSSMWKNYCKLCGPLLLVACQTLPPEEDSPWLKDLPETLSNACKLWIREGHLRRSQAGNILIGLNSKKKYIDLISPLLVTKWQEKVFENVFSTHSKESRTSFLAMILDSNKLSRSLPTPNDLWPSDQVAQVHLFQQLPLLVWYGLRFRAPGHPWTPLSVANDDPNLVALDTLPKRPLCEAFPKLKKFNKDLPGINQATPESLSQIDIDAFLFATVCCASGVEEENQRRWSEDRPEVLPTALTDSLCTPAQISWWTSVCEVLKPSTTNHYTSTKSRKQIRSGLEAVRSVDSQSGHQDVRLLCSLARFFNALASKAQETEEDSQLVTALFLRSSHYWSCAKPALENIKSGRSVRISQVDRLFTLSGKELDPASAESLLYEACFSDGMQLMRDNRYEEAIEAFGDLSSPYASMQQALLYKKLGETERTDLSMKEIYMKRSLDNFYITLDRLKGPKVDPRHPLNSSLRSHIEETEEQINEIFPNAHINNPIHRQDILSDASDEEDFVGSSQVRRGQSSTPLTSSRVRPMTLANGTPVNGRQRHTPSTLRSPALNTHRPREEARPSPERLEAQMRQLSVQREGELQAMARIVEATRSNDFGLRNELQYLKDAVRDINKDLQTIQREMMEQRRETQDLSKTNKDIHSEMMKIVKQLKTIQISQARPAASVPRETRNIPDEELYLYGEEELENELEQSHLQQQPASAAAAALLAGNLPAMYNPAAGFPFRTPPPNFFPLARGVDTAALMYQNLAYLAPGALPFSEGQRLPEFQVATPQLLGGVMPVQAPNVAVGFSRMPQGPVVTDISPVQTPQIQPEIPAAVAAAIQQQSIFEASPHAFQISMPAGAQIPITSPLEKAPPVPQISPQSMLQNVPSPAYSSVTPEVKTPRTSRISVGSAVSEEGEVLEHDAMSDFKPIIPLPDEVVLTTGEEGENVLFENRAKLFRFVEGEWKERGIGLLKILENPETKKVRILMRREQVLKVCCNHQVPSDISLSHISGNEKTWSWAAHDFADETMRVEKFGVRFKTPEEANTFRDVIEKVKTTMPLTPNSKTNANKSASPITPAKLTALPSTPNTSLLSSPPKSTSSLATVSLGGFTFTAAPTVTAKPKEDKADSPKKEEAPKPGPFSSFTFSNVFGKTTTTPSATTTTFSLGQTTVFQNSPLAQLSFSSIAQNSPISPFSTPSKPETTGSFPLVFGSTPKSGVIVTPADSSSTVSTSGDGESAEDFVPTADFKPVVPLPELVEIKTGEEGEEILYEQRAKLLRYSSELKQWKERGIGKMKMTWNPTSCKVRLVMRREQVLKVCCNHFLGKDMKLLPISSSDRSWTWVAQDYSEGSLETETLAIKFKRPEEAVEFQEKWLQLQKDMVDGDRLLKDGQKPAQKTPEIVQKPLSELFKPAKGTWECQSCYVSNKADSPKCAACASPRDGKSSPEKAAVPSLSADKDLMSQFKKPEGSWNCEACYVQNKSDVKKCAACESARPGASPDKAPAATKSIAPGLTFDFKSSSTSKFSFGTPASATSTAATTTTAAPTFSFGEPKATTVTSTPSTFAFGSQSSFSFGIGGTPAAPTTTPSFGFCLPTPTNVTPAAQAEAEESDEEVENDEGEHIHFTPVIPLPDMVQVVTGEEDEEVLYSHRAKLFRWAAGEWKERGLGDIKILKHKENKTIRLLMRREQVLKICLNHRLTADLTLQPKGDSGRSYQWVAADFSEGEVHQEQFAILFKTEDMAKDFLEAVKSAQESLASGDLSISVQVSSPGQNSTFSKADTSAVSSYLDTSVASSAQFQTPSKSFSFAQDSIDPSAAVTPSFAFGDTSSVVSDDEVKIVEIIEPKVTAEDVAKARALQLPDNFYAYKQFPSCKGCPGCEPDDDSTETPTKEKSSVPPTTSMFGAATFASLAPINGSVAPANIFLPTNNSMSFASLAKDNSQTGFGNLAGGPSFSWAGSGTPVFGSGAKPAPIFGAKSSPLLGQKPVALFASPSNTENDDGGESGGEEEAHDPHFEPIIALPDIVTVRTGEEDEEKVFCQRAKLYRYDTETKEWKERGVGEMKLLLHQATGRYRLLLRREQVHKVVLNQLLTKDVDLKPMKTSNNAVCWGALNHAEEGDPRTEELAIKFKNEDLLAEFKNKVNEAKERLAAQPPAPMPSTGPTPPPTGLLGNGPKTPPQADHEETDEDDEDEEEDEDDYETYDEDFPETIMSENRGTVFSRKGGDPLGPWLALGVGFVKILHYPDYPYNVVVELDVNHGGETVRIVVDANSNATSEKTQDKEVSFSGINEAQDANRLEYYKVLFENSDAADEFQSYFAEGLVIAENLMPQGELDVES